MTLKCVARKAVTGRRGSTHRQLPDDLKETRGCWKLKQEALFGEFALEEAVDLS